MAACESCRSPSGAPNRFRVAARSVISCKARRAKPSAAAPTVERKISSVAIATLKPSPGAPSARADRHAHIVEAQRRQRMRRDHVDPFGHRQSGRIGIDHKGGQAFRARRFAAAREDDIMIGDAAIRDPGLAARKPHMRVAIGLGRHRKRRDVRARVRLRQCKGRDRLALAHRRQITASSFRASRKARSNQCRGPAWRKRNRRGRHGKQRISRARQSVRTSSCGVRSAEFRRHNRREESRIAQCLHPRAAGRIDIVMRQFMKRGFRPARQLRSETPVTIVEEGPGQRLGERHVSYPRRPASVSPRRRGRRA